MRVADSSSEMLIPVIDATAASDALLLVVLTWDAGRSRGIPLYSIARAVNRGIWKARTLIDGRRRNGSAGTG
jgi:hypothetical protein